MQKIIKRLLVTAAAAGAAMAAGTASAAQDIKIGVAEALSGGAAQYGAAIRNGFQLAADEINAAGGVNGSKIALVIEDEQGKKEEAINVFKKLIFQDKVAMVFGPTLSNSAQAADPIAQGAKTVVFGTSNTADGITSIGDHVFRNSVTEADVLPATIQTVVKKAGVKKVAVLYGNDDVFTKSGYDNFKKALEDLKIPVTATETFAKGDVDFKAQLTKIKATNPDAIVLSALIAEGGPIMVQARQLGLNVPIIGGNGMNSVKVFDLARDKSDNLWVGSPWSIENHTPENSKFITAYTARYKAAPDQFAAQAYDAMHIAAQALKTVKFSGNLEADRKAIRDALPAVKHTGATGAFAFRQVTARGKPAGYDAVQTPIVSVTKAGKYTIEK
ncbi:ABC transporter substrate-binding protein [Ralstonia pseudosolanacearum]|uniref:ABC transporter substrate-binding protein n=2 Tax=Ralstonia solanacearum species complex TaxID=3116862 RepID=A0A0S4U520_RALSL|nr:ABC transporter substrate-binding protein [Ralstonia pseudosolanacearum]APC65841.1 ABC transporter substrate-binding protein [Ralstonia solanacearum OE1-1]AUS44253.1 ABC transporter substrate-binding protein [Ralstonia solanacearum]API76690.1 ABC transporter substrate-binding protein [Ralstonia pseudosolanacearum]ASL75902.1 ABC transporter substrate-binding protein [Ralstonia pseudosolanacearum]AST88911.1 ABC transporter substrate-binding protein [Ralstonia pseudosolanacearum]